MNDDTIYRSGREAAFAGIPKMEAMIDTYVESGWMDKRQGEITKKVMAVCILELAEMCDEKATWQNILATFEGVFANAQSMVCRTTSSYANLEMLRVTAFFGEQVAAQSVMMTKQVADGDDRLTQFVQWGKPN